MSSLSRRKGHGFEREIAIKLRHIFPNARRHLEYQDQEANGVDLAETGPLQIQCKKLKKYAPLTAIQEIKFDPIGIPVLVTAADREPILIAMHLNDFLPMLKAWLNTKKQTVDHKQVWLRDSEASGV